MQDRFPDAETLTVGLLYEYIGKRLGLVPLTGSSGFSRKVSSPDVNRPGLCLSGYKYKFMHDRIQIFGETEMVLLENLSPEKRASALKNVFSFPVYCCIVTKGIQPSEELVSAAKTADAALFLSPRDTTPLIRDLSEFLSEVFAPHISLHGTLVDIFGEGVLVTGRSSIGKSEAVLGLVERGHRLVADDLVRIRRTGNRLIGTGDELMGFYMEIRGIGLVSISELFGVSATKEMQSVDMVVKLIDSGLVNGTDRSGLEEQTHNILGVDVPFMEIPVLPGRNITLLLEVAARMNIQTKDTGSSSAERLNRKLIARMTGAEQREENDR